MSRVTVIRVEAAKQQLERARRAPADDQHQQEKDKALLARLEQLFPGCRVRRGGGSQ